MRKMYNSLVFIDFLGLYLDLCWSIVAVSVSVLSYEEMMSSHLFGPQTGWDPGVLLQSAARVVVGRGAALEAGRQLADFLLHHQVSLARPLEARRSH